MVSLGLLLSGLDSSGFSLFLKLGLSDFLLLHLVDGLNQHRFVLEKVTLGAEIEVMVDILGDFLGLSVFLRSLLRTLCLRIQRTLEGILAFLVPFLLPKPLCLPKSENLVHCSSTQILPRRGISLGDS